MKLTSIYEYVNNHPTLATDPSGFDEENKENSDKGQVLCDKLKGSALSTQARYINCALFKQLLEGLEPIKKSREGWDCTIRQTKEAFDCKAESGSFTATVYLTPAEGTPMWTMLQTCVAKCKAKLPDSPVDTLRYMCLTKHNDGVKEVTLKGWKVTLTAECKIVCTK